MSLTAVVLCSVLLAASSALFAARWLTLAVRDDRAKILSRWERDGTTFIVRDDRHWRELVADDGSRAMIHTRVRRADTLVSGCPYTDGFHLAVALSGSPRRALFIGGGGAVGPRQFAAFYPTMEIDVVEIDAHVLTAARAFLWLAEGERLRTHLADGREFLAGSPDDAFDVVVLDAYRAAGHLPSHLSSEEFFAILGTKLRPGGAVCANLVADRSSSAPGAAIAMFTVFGEQCRFFRVPAGMEGPSPNRPNWIGLAVRRPQRHSWDELADRAARLDPRLRFAVDIVRRPAAQARTWAADLPTTGSGADGPAGEQGETSDTGP